MNKFHQSIDLFVIDYTFYLLISIQSHHNRLVRLRLEERLPTNDKKLSFISFSSKWYSIITLPHQMFHPSCLIYIVKTKFKGKIKNETKRFQIPLLLIYAATTDPPIFRRAKDWREGVFRLLNAITRRTIPVFCCRKLCCTKANQLKETLSVLNCLTNERIQES